MAKARKWNTQNFQLTVELHGHGVVIRNKTIGPNCSVAIGNMNDLLELIFILKKASHRLCDEAGIEQCALEEMAEDARAAKKRLKRHPPKLSLVK